VDLGKITFYVVPAVMGGILLWSLIRRRKTFEIFCEGAKEGLGTAVRILPPLIAVMTAIGMFRACGALELFCQLLRPAMEGLGIPAEVLPLALLRPISGSGSLAVLEDILRQYGADSLIGRVASVLQGSTETTFYTIAVYFGATSVTRTRHTLPSALLGDILSIFISAWAVRLFLGG